MFVWIQGRNKKIKEKNKAIKESFKEAKTDLPEKARRYVQDYYREPVLPETQKQKENEIHYSHDLSFFPEIHGERPSDDVKFSPRGHYDGDSIRSVMRSLSDTDSPLRALQMLDSYTDGSFVDKMLEHINDKHLRDASVYKAAQIDRRLFSKIVSDSTYKPAKDTCVALCLALHLTLNEANDLLSRAGYTFSHSSKRDVILEFFFREEVYDIMQVNEVLYKLGQKALGR